MVRNKPLITTELFVNIRSSQRKIQNSSLEGDHRQFLVRSYVSEWSAR